MPNLRTRRACTPILFALIAPAVLASDEPIHAGRYRVVAQMVMPHLEENLRYAVVRESRCLDRRTLSSIFPVLRHPSLGGCVLSEEQQDGDTLRYRLNCKSREVATGAAWLEPRPSKIVGELQVRMGGKNMTFSQRVQATYRGACGPAEQATGLSRGTRTDPG